MIDIALSLRQGFIDAESFSAYLLQSSFFVFAILIPILQIFFCSLFFIVPLFRSSKPFYLLVEWVTTAACLDVFVVAILASILSLEKFGRFMIGHHCDAINILIEKYAGNSLSDPRCVDTTSSLLDGFWFLLCCSVISFVNCRLVLYLAHKEKFEEKVEIEYDLIN